MLTDGTYGISIKDVHLSASIGIYEHEKQQRQPLYIQCDIQALKPANRYGDMYQDVVCYHGMTQLIIACVQRQHYETLEYLAELLCDEVLAHKQVVDVTLYLTKPQALQDLNSHAYPALCWHKSVKE